MKSSTCQVAEADPTPGEGERQQGQKKKGQDPLLHWLEVHTQSPCQKRRQENVEPTPLQSRPADQRMTQGHPEAWPETAPKSPTVAIPSFEIRSTDSDPQGDPILKEYRTANQSRLRYDRVCENNTPDPQGDPIAKQLRIDERKKPSFRSSAQKSATRPEMGDPIAKARHQPLGKVRKKSSFRLRSGTTPTRQGDPIAKTPTKHQEGGGRDFVPIED